MDWLAIISPAAVLGVLGLLFGGLLGVASKKFAVEVDETVANLRQYLPGANCSGCGYPSCDAFAEAVVHNGVDVSGCAVISAENLVKAGKAVGQEVKVSGQKKAVVLCQGTRENSPPRYEYEGIHSCKAAAMVSGGNKGCRYACLGNGDCISACAFGAISMGPGNIPVIDFEKCTGCGACSRKCPRNVIGMVPMEAKVVVLCRTQERGRTVRQACSRGCITCRLCERACPTRAINCDSGVAVVDYTKCIGCLECTKKCPSPCIDLFGPETIV